MIVILQCRLFFFFFCLWQLAAFQMQQRLPSPLSFLYYQKEISGCALFEMPVRLSLSKVYQLKNAIVHKDEMYNI